MSFDFLTGVKIIRRILETNKKTQAGHYYAMELAKVIVSEINSVTRRAGFFPVMGEYKDEFNYQVASSNVNLSNVSHIITNAYIYENCVYAEIKLLPTTQGKILAFKLSQVDFRLRGSGAEKNGMILLSDYTLCAVDAIKIKYDWGRQQ